MKQFISFILLALLGFALKVISAPKHLFMNKNEILEINRRLDSIGRL